MTQLGVIGYVEGNGHPYSWSAICNGYDPETMKDCGYPAIPTYLARRQWPQDRLPNAIVTHVWTQDDARSRHIAKAALIENVVTRPEHMIGAVDGILLARDDAENHIRFAAPFLEAGIPVYLDKAPALTVGDFEALCARQARPGLIFTGTPLRYAHEFKLEGAACEAVGAVRHIFGMTPKSWDRYAIHVIEPALLLLKNAESTTSIKSWSGGDARGLNVSFANGTTMGVAALGNVTAPISLRVVGEKGWCDLVFADSFSCFRITLEKFVADVREATSHTDLGFMRRVVELLEFGRA